MPSTGAAPELSPDQLRLTRSGKPRGPSARRWGRALLGTLPPALAGPGAGGTTQGQSLCSLSGREGDCSPDLGPRGRPPLAEPRQTPSHRCAGPAAAGVPPAPRLAGAGGRVSLGGPCRGVSASLWESQHFSAVTFFLSCGVSEAWTGPPPAAVPGAVRGSLVCAQGRRANVALGRLGCPVCDLLKKFLAGLRGPMLLL